MEGFDVEKDGHLLICFTLILLVFTFYGTQM